MIDVKAIFLESVLAASDTPESVKDAVEKVVALMQKTLEHTDYQPRPEPAN